MAKVGDADMVVRSHAIRLLRHVETCQYGGSSFPTYRYRVISSIPSVWKQEIMGWDHLKHLRVNVMLGSAVERRAALREAIGFTKPFYLESCHDWYTQGKALGLVDKKPQAGDLFLLLNKNKQTHHIGFVTEALPESEFRTIEGNTNTGGSDNGDGVYERVRNVADSVFFHLPAEFKA